MEEGGLTLFDWIVIAVIGLSGILALFRGFIREVLSLMAWLVAAFVTINYFSSLRDMLSQHIDSKMIVLGLSTVGLFLGLLLILSIINAMIMRFLQAGSDISILDSALGMCFGVVRGLFILSLAYVMFSVVMPRDQFPEMVTKGRTLPLVEYSVGVLESLAPEYVQQLGDASEAAKAEGDRIAREKAEDELRKMQESGTYDKDKRMELERLLETLGSRSASDSEAAE